MLRKAMLATTLVVASLAIPAIFPQDANAQIVVGSRRFGVGVGRPYYGGYGYGGYYGYRPTYYNYPSYRYYYPTYQYAPRYYGRYWY